MKQRIAFIICVCLFFVSCKIAPDRGLTDINGEMPGAPPSVSQAGKNPEPEPPGSSFIEDLSSNIVHNEILEGDKTGEEAIRAIYHWLIQNVYFSDPVGLDAWRYLSDEVKAVPYIENRALSPLLFKIGSCEDFAAAAVLLLRAAGFDAEYVAGFTLSRDQAYIDHAWAIVRLNGNWYHLDPQLEQNVTKENTITYRYYLKSDDAFNTDHKWGELLIAHWPDMPELEKHIIRRLYTPPSCFDSYPSPQKITTHLPLKPDMTEIDGDIRKIKRESGKGELPDIALNVEPPILVLARHITPPLLKEPFGGLALTAGYGRSFLNGAEAELYDRLFKSLTSYPLSERIPVPKGITDARVNYVTGLLLDDEPIFYWANFQVAYENNISYITLSSSISPEVIQRQREDLKARAGQILAMAKDATDFERALIIHDALAAVGYDRLMEGKHSDNVYGALMEGKATCNGYTRGFQYLAGLAGLEAVYIRGHSLRGAKHAWNAVKLDDFWHFADTTWDRPLKEYDDVYHDYFLINNEELLRERFWDENQYPELPDAGGAGFAGYYTRMDYIIDIPPPKSGSEQALALAEVFYRQLKAKDTLPTQAAPVFLELKITGDSADYLRWKEAYIKQVFNILEYMSKMAAKDNLQIKVIKDDSIKCNFNDAIQVLTFYPEIEHMEDDGR